MKKIMAVMAAALLAVTLTSCDKLGQGFTFGTKWNKTMTVDGTSINKTYKRFIKKLSVSKEVTDIETKITIYQEKDNNGVEKFPLSNNDNKKAVVGLAYDFTTTGTGDNKKYDFVLVGINPKAGTYYIEHYVNVTKDGSSDFDEAIDENAEDLGDSGFITDNSALGSYYSYTTASQPDDNLYLPTAQVSDYIAIPGGLELNADGNYEVTVSIQQETKGKYTIKINDNIVATLDGVTTKLTDAKNEADIGKCAGGIALYANAPKGCKVKAKFASDRTKTNGLFVEEE